jgi:hypothetical protein
MNNPTNETPSNTSSTYFSSVLLDINQSEKVIARFMEHSSLCRQVASRKGRATWTGAHPAARGSLAESLFGAAISSAVLFASA